MRRAGVLLVTAGVIGCGSFRGPGRFQTSSEYTGGGESVDATFTPPAAPIVNGVARLSWPVGVVRINRGFRPASDPRHQGLDLGGTLGTPILAAHHGRVVYAGHDFHGYGNMVILEYDNHLATLYAHLSRIQVSEGLDVHSGDRLGQMGRTGHATGVHLHFEVMRDRQPVNPIEYLPGALRGLATARNGH